MAKPLGPKSLLIRDAIKAHPDLSPKEIADKLNDSQDRLDDKISVKPMDVSQQKQQMKKAEGEAAPAAAAAAPAAAKRGRPKGKGGRPRKAAPAGAAPRAAVRASASPLDLIDRVF